MRDNEESFDFRPLGLAIKEARKKRGLTRKQVAEIIYIDPRYLTNIENKGQHPSLHILFKLVTMFNLSVDQYIYPDVEPAKSSRRRQLDYALNSLDDKDLLVLESTAYGITQSKKE